MSKPVIYITGDCHHYLRDHPIQKKEPIFAEEWVRILCEFGLVGTLFVTGKCIIENKQIWEKIAKSEFVELGGHTYYALRDLIGKGIKFLWEKLDMELNWLSSLYWKNDVRLLLNAFQTIGVKPVSWRTHAYLEQKSLYKILRNKGFRVVSNKVLPGHKLAPYYENGLLHVPINVTTDDIVWMFFIQKMDVKVLRKILYKNIHKAVEARENICIQLHPVCMKLLDNFITFRKLIKEIYEADYRSLMLKHALKLLKQL
jgi:hypothetical protein